MLPRNLTLYRLPRVFATPRGEELQHVLAECAIKPLGPFELHTHGFVSPYGGDAAALFAACGDCVLLTLGAEHKILPVAVLNKALAERMARIAEAEGRSPGGRERKRLRDEVLAELLPKAFAKPSRGNAWLDLARGWLVVDSASRKVAEGFVAAIREALGSFPALPVNAESSPRALLTAWISGEALPDGFELGDECELRDPVDSGAVVKCRRQDLGSEEVLEHLKAGKQGFHLALVYERRLGFVLGDDLVLRKLRFLDAAAEALEREERDDPRYEVDAQFAIVAGEVGRLLDALTAALSLSEADAVPAGRA